MQNSVISVRITNLYVSQPSSVVFACKAATFGWELLVSMGPRLLLLIFCECKTAVLDPEWRLSIGPSLHLWFSAFKTAPLASELLVSMGSSPHLSFGSCKTAWLALELLVSMGPRPHLSFCACKTTRFATEWLDSMGPTTHLWFLQVKLRLLDQNYKQNDACLLVPVFICGLVHS